MSASMRSAKNGNRSAVSSVLHCISKNLLASFAACAILFNTFGVAAAAQVGSNISATIESITDVFSTTLTTSESTEEIDQEEDGSGSNYNQQAATELASDADADATQTGSALNTVSASQDNQDDGQSNQSATLDILADTRAGLILGSRGANTGTIKQKAVGEGSNYNQDGDIGANAESSVDGDQEATSANELELSQEAIGDEQNNQDAWLGNEATTDATLDIDGTAENISEIDQEEESGYGGAAIGSLDAASGSNYNQDADVDADADLDVSASQEASSTNETEASQESDAGQVNQWLDLLNRAGTAASVDIDAAARNETTITQHAEGGVGGASQSAGIEGDADLDADADVDASSGNDSIGAQDITGLSGGNYNQDAGVESAAETAVETESEVLSANVSGILQVATDGQGNQGADVGNGATAESGQEVDAEAVNGTLLDQTAVGDGSNYNQNGDIANDAASGVEAGQEVLTANVTGVTQVMTDGQNNQSAGLWNDADTDATQVIDSLAANDTDASQHEEGDEGGNYNQNLDLANNAESGVAALQLAGAGNLTEVTQDAGTGQNAQDIALDNVANTDASQGIGSVAANVTDVSQEEEGDGSNYNQNVDHTAGASAGVLALQGVESGNLTGSAQIAADGQNAQKFSADSDADAIGDQDILAAAVNDTTITQHEEGGYGGAALGSLDAASGGNYNQAAVNEVEADAGVAALQEVTAGNLTGNLQVAGAGQNAQDASVWNDADADGTQTLEADAINDTTISQTEIGDGDNYNQALGNWSGAGAGVEAGQLVSSGNLTGNEQIAADGQNAQKFSADNAAKANGEQEASAVAANTSDISQLEDGSGSNYNQALENDAIAGVGVAGLQGVAALNATGNLQVAGSGQNAQDASVWNDADADASQTLTGLANNDNTLSQTEEGEGGNYNQALSNSNAAGSLVGGAQLVASGNLTGNEQIAGDGQNAQNFWNDNTAEADADQEILAAAVNDNTISQTEDGEDYAGGNYNQALENENTAGAGAGALQILLVGSATSNLQVAGAGQNAQDADITNEATADALQLVEADAVNANSVSQEEVGGGANYNQDLANFNNAGAVSGGAQFVASGNLTGNEQIASDGQNAQKFSADNTADAIADQGALAVSANDNDLSQLEEGEGSNYNQAMENQNYASAGAGALQGVVVLNATGNLQVAGAGQNAQDASVWNDADADGSQEASALALNDNVLSQTEEGDGSNYNQDLDNYNSAGAGVEVGQTVTAGNLTGNEQIAADGQNAQNFSADNTAEADADQSVLAVAANTNDISQHEESGYGGASVGSLDAAAGANYNQLLDNENYANSGAAAGQTVTAGSATGNLQVAGAGQNAQDASIWNDADADGVQVVEADAVNDNEISQTAIGDGANYNQGLWNYNSAGTSVGAGQTVTAGNLTGSEQIAGDGQNGQSFSADNTADAKGGQGVLAVAANTNDLSQLEEGEGSNYNQLLENENYANSGVGAGQTVTAGNVTGNLQVAGEGQNAQSADIWNDADADGEQEAIGLALNDNTIAQTEIGEGANYNQALDNYNSAGVGVGAGQTVTADNLTENEQIACEYGDEDCQNKQNFGADNTAEADGSQLAIGVAKNTNEISQHEESDYADAPGVNYNQLLDNENYASSGVGAGQTVSASNDTDNVQVAGSDDNAQNAEIWNDADADGTQVVEADAINDNEISQTEIGDGANYNQGLDNYNSAGSGVGAGQEIEAENEVDNDQSAGDGQNAQNFWNDNTAKADGDQDVLVLAKNLNDLSQHEEGEGSNYNQLLENENYATAGAEVAQEVEAGNEVKSEQTAGSGQNAQDAGIWNEADADGTQEVTVAALNDNDVSQTEIGDGTNYNQDLDNYNSATSGAGADQKVEAENEVDSDQEAGDGQNGQNFWNDNAAEADADQSVGAVALNTNDLSQHAEGGYGGAALGSLDAASGGNYNQNAANEGYATSDAGADQEVEAENDVENDQTAGSGQNAQSADVSTDADADGAQGVEADAINDTELSQTAIGEGANYNQDLDNVVDADADVEAEQKVEAENEVDSDQEAGDGQNGQSFGAHTDVKADGEQGALAVAANLSDLSQYEEGTGSNYNQQADNNAKAGAEVKKAEQKVEAENDVENDQTAGSGQNAQNAETWTHADADGAQGLEADAVNDTEISQAAIGEDYGANYNQALDNDVDADAKANDAEQEVEAENEIDNDQEAGDGQNKQNFSADADADADGVQGALALALNAQDLSQYAEGDGSNYNQAAENDADADAKVNDAEQEVEAENDVENDQTAGSGDNAQSADVSLDADADGIQGLEADAINDTEMSQVEIGGGANYNQDMENDVDADAKANDAKQEVEAENDVDSDQEAGDGQNAQNLHAHTDATADGAQSGDAVAANLSDLSQYAEGGYGDDDSGNYNQAAENDADADAKVNDAEQEIEAENEVENDQTAGEGQNAQDADVSAKADADGTQDLDAAAVNDTEMSQIEIGGGANYNQDMENDVDADAKANDAKQEVEAENDIENDQEAGDGQNGQNLAVDADADADGTQKAVATAANLSDLSQYEEGTGSNYNQSMGCKEENNHQGQDGEPCASADAKVNDAEQEIEAENEVDNDQTAGDGQNAQDAYVTVIADADGSQDLEADATNDTDLSQIEIGSGENYNQNVENAVDADAEVNEAEQEVEAENDVDSTQEATGPQVAQSTSIDAEADADGEQEADATSLNFTKITQKEEGGYGGYGAGNYNQNAENEADADSDTDVEQEVEAENEIEVSEESDGGQAGQATEIWSDATADGDQSADSTATNSTEVTQEEEGDGGNYNQDADLDNDADADAAADQDVEAENDLGTVEICAGTVCAQYTRVGSNTESTGKQDVNADGTNDNKLSQTEDGSGGNYNQNAELENDAASSAEGDQEVEAETEVKTKQGCTGEVCAQLIEVVPDTTADADQEVTSDAGNTNDVSQTETGEDGGSNYNQNADLDNNAESGADGDQKVDAKTDVEAEQDCDSTVCAQLMKISPKTKAKGKQEVDSDATNDNTVKQTESAGSGSSANYNQNAELENDAASDAEGDQELSAENTIKGSQGCKGVLCAQSAIIRPEAEAEGEQDVHSNAANTDLVEQTEEGDGSGNYNQNAEVDNDANSDATGTQKINAKNTVDLTQDCDSDLCAQDATVDPTATASGTQDVTSDATNDSVVKQKEDGDGSNYNQSANGTSTTNSTATSTQNVTSGNSITIIQE